MLEFVKPISDALGLSPEACLAILGLLGGIFALLTVNQIVASLSDTKKSPKSLGTFDTK